jgi:hypothetical protein
MWKIFMIIFHMIHQCMPVLQLKALLALMTRKTAFLSLLILFIAASSVFAAGVIQLPQTGQTKCYDTYGSAIACTGTGQDGEINPRVTPGTGAA